MISNEIVCADSLAWMTEFTENLLPILFCRPSLQHRLELRHSTEISSTTHFRGLESRFLSFSDLGDDGSAQRSARPTWKRFAEGWRKTLIYRRTNMSRTDLTTSAEISRVLDHLDWAGAGESATVSGEVFRDAAEVIRQLGEDLNRWRQYAGFCRSVAMCGEPMDQTFEEFCAKMEHRLPVRESVKVTVEVKDTRRHEEARAEEETKQKETP